MINIQKTLATIVKINSNILGDNLVGIYLHGSLAMGCYTEKSDIDFLVVAHHPLDLLTAENLVKSLITLPNLPSKGIEMSVVLKCHTINFCHPIPFELHYSNKHKQTYLEDKNYICKVDMDKDLTAHIMIIKHRGVCLFGDAIDDIFSHVPRNDYINSIMYVFGKIKTTQKVPKKLAPRKWK